MKLNFFFNRNCHNSAGNNGFKTFDRFFSRKYYVSQHLCSIFAFPGNSREFFWDFPYFPFPGKKFWSGKSTALSYISSFINISKIYTKKEALNHENVLQVSHLFPDVLSLGYKSLGRRKGHQRKRRQKSLMVAKCNKRK